MQWSKLRTLVEEHFAESVKGRVRLHTTRYRRMHDQEGRAWITVDGREIINMPHIFKWFYERDKRAAELAGLTHEFRNWDLYCQKQLDAERQLQEESIFPQGELGQAMRLYASLSIDDILGHEHVLIKSIGMLDKRLGKRRLTKMDPNSMHPLIKLLYLFRCDAEGIAGSTPLHSEDAESNPAAETGPLC